MCNTIMLYKKDFQYLTERYINKDAIKKANPGDSMDKGAAAQEDCAIISFWKLYCFRSTLHGLRYVVENDLRAFERLIWALLVLLSIFGTTHVCIMLANRFYSSPLQTVVESTIYPVYKIPFPAVTICNYNRVNWDKIEDAKQKFMPNATEEDTNLFIRFVKQMEILEFGNFDEFAMFENSSLNSLDHINITELYDFINHSCEKMFLHECWWRYKNFPCCQIFVKQKTEFGICYAFNSAVNGIGLNRLRAKEKDWPHKTSMFGDWSGLRISIFAEARTKPPGSTNPLGIFVIIHNPFEWPNNAVFVPSGTSAAVLIKPKLTYAKLSTRRIDPTSRECVFPDEAENPKFRNLPGLDYYMNNCLSECRQNYILESCNCTMEAYFPIGNYTPCKASDFKCLNANNDLYNFEKPVKEEGDEDNNENVMICACLHSCVILDYQAEIVPMHLAKENFSEEMILLDVHYQHGTLIKYRTDVVYGWLDLLVAFGGIAGLFMGASMLSGVEIFYYLTIGLYVYMQDRFRKRKVESTAPNFTTNHHNGLQIFETKITVENRRRRNKLQKIAWTR